MIGMIELATTQPRHRSGPSCGEFALEMVVGLAVGRRRRRSLLGAADAPRVAARAMALYPLRTLAARRRHLRRGDASRTAPASSPSSSPGCSIGDVRAPYKGEIERFHGSLATPRRDRRLRRARADRSTSRALSDDRLARRARCSRSCSRSSCGRSSSALAPRCPPAAARRAAVHRLGRAQGSGADPARGLRAARTSTTAPRVYEIVFVVVASRSSSRDRRSRSSRARLGVPMRAIEPEPWNVSIRLRREPHDLRRFVVAAGSPCCGSGPFRRSRSRTAPG